MALTPEQILQIMPGAANRVARFQQPLVNAMLEFTIVTAKRQSAFLAQIAHESGELRYVRELSDGSQYEGRADLGNTEPGDGHRYLGRGLLQVTGRTNYKAVGLALGLDLLSHPELLESPDPAARSAGYFWRSHNLNEFADADAFGSITKKINGGYLGLDQRLAYWVRARKACGL